MNVPMWKIAEKAEEARNEGYWDGVLSSILVLASMALTLSAMYYFW